ncbi:putative RNA-directed DNA polymerase from transposon X-element [Araneus ventricosus]|uniref:Putative RNA-directed DNA polymerase from transposon X-element n=1 Tax=Araneus ventricosus TaxID=182803 RepID=A0A4Y2S3T0_ARAVE|nr:putative RNA-directed DNA polymerase from transposon X-element [Araneus ventricosus]
MGDFNGHNPIWGSPDINLRGQQIETLIDNHCFCLLNSSNHTYFHQPTRTFHTLDLALCSPSLVIKWNFNTEDDLFNSDHFPIILSYIDNDIRYPERPRKFIFQKANWSLFSEFATLTLDMVEEVSIDDAVDKVTCSIIQAADMAIPKTSGKIPKIWKPWWNEECRIFNKQQKKAWDKFRRYPTTSNLIDFKFAKATFRRVKRTSQRKSWQAFISTITNQISSKKLWDKIRRLSGRYNDNTSVSFLNHNGQVITDAKKIANTLAEAFSAVSSASSYSQDFISHKTNEERHNIDFNTLTDDEYNSDFHFIEFKRALSKSHATSPGPDNIHLLMLTHLTETSLHNILKLFNRIWKEKKFPSSWRRAVVIPILKPGKDAKNPNNYRPIALTSVLCKLLERMVNSRLVHVLEKKKCLSPFQSGFRFGRGTIDNILLLENSIREAFVSKKHLVSILFDMEKAYDKTWRVRIGNTLSDGFYQEEGVPQGSVLSVILFIIKINEVIKQLPTGVSGSLFVDDLEIHCSGEDMGFVERKLQEAVNKISEWGRNNGFQISSQKTVAIHFCRRRGLHLDPKLLLHDCTIPIVRDAKYLGLIFDSKLTFKPHVNYLKRKCIQSLNIIKMLSGTSYGAETSALLKVYKALIRSKLDYGCVVYGSASKSVLKALDTVHHQGLRLSLGAFRTSPIQSIYVLCKEPSLELRRELLTLNTFFKIKSNSSHPMHYKVINPIYGSLFSLRLSFTPTFGFRVGGILRNLNINDFPILEKVDEFPPWKDIKLNFIDDFEHLPKSTTSTLVYRSIFYEHRHRFSNYEPVFTDGSKSEGHVGTAVAMGNTVVSERLHKFCSVFTSEIYGIYLALTKMDSFNKNFIVYTDSKSAIEALKKINTLSHPLALKCAEMHQYLTEKGLKIAFCWIPGHAGISGNEKADQASKLRP